MLTTALGTAKIIQKHTPLINQLYKTSRNDSAFYGRNAMTIDMVEIMTSLHLMYSLNQ